LKPASVISLVVAAMLVIAGFTACLIAKGMAESEGELLFAEKRGEDLVNTVKLDDTPVNNLDLTLTDTDVYIHGQSSNAYMEIVNYRDNYYNISTKNQILSFTEVHDLLSMFKFWENGFTFKGMRYIFNFSQPMAEGRKSLHIYLGTTETKLSEVTLHAENCNIYFDKVSTGTAFYLSLTNSSLSMNEVSVSNTLSVTGEDITLNMNDCITGNLSITSTNLEMLAKNIVVDTKANILFDTGTADIQLSSAFTNLSIALSAQQGGAVTVNGNPVGAVYNQLYPGVYWGITAKNGGNIIFSDNTVHP